ncbi:low affinity potassium transporter [Pleurotus ostreatus]|uniref:Potassium transport protein n=1 Tax=Pleurotus ostreatus TaxID=5322 RepID=A0A8H6ZMK9_PLEOS|nr:low affinity potassium transporter [Pleurotus ostreatus]KAF7422341.1 low affinity potassium transporter [Pleurotus ostreatus]
MARLKLWASVRGHLNFYRIHVLTFTLLPLVFSGIFYASNGRQHVDYVDALFICVSAFTNCGLETVELSYLTPWQQVLIFMQMCMGSPVVVSWLVVLVRRYHFAKTFKTAIAASATDDLIRRGDSRTFIHHEHLDAVPELSRETSGESRVSTHNVRPEMETLNEKIGIQQTNVHHPVSILQKPGISPHHSSNKDGKEENPPLDASLGRKGGFTRRFSDPGADMPLINFDLDSNDSIRHRGRFRRPYTSHIMEWSPPPTQPPVVRDTRGELHARIEEERRSTHRQSMTPRPRSIRTVSSLNRGFGGFPMPDEIFSQLVRKLSSRSHSTNHPRRPEIQRPPSYLRFNPIIGRNSTFYLQSEEQLIELGGVEYRALNALLILVPCYHIGLQLIAFIILAPYISTHKWSSNFVPPQVHRRIPPPWWGIYYLQLALLTEPDYHRFALFQSISSYTNNGMSLVDQSMVPFQRAYVMVIVMAFLILAGNTCFPIFLRFLIWVISRLVRRESRLYETLQFLLDHPRRCFLYLFPSHQTWYLLTVVVSLTFTDWFFFVILDIDNPDLATIPIGLKCFIGVLQAVSIRTAGVATVAMSSIAPAVKVLYVVMMYISVYPIALSIRSTNVYEEQSLGIYAEIHDEDRFVPSGSRARVWGNYIALHARRQLAFDIWWIALAIFLVTIIERPSLDKIENYAWFNNFSIIFELVSAYGVVGLSLGTPTENYALSGAFRPLSKLIVCIVMIRGRHRGLPVAIDQAVLLPQETMPLATQPDSSEVRS